MRVAMVFTVYRPGGFAAAFFQQGGMEDNCKEGGKLAVLNIKDPEAHVLASEIARRTGQTLTRVVTEALRERLARENAKTGDRGRLVARVLEIGHRAAGRPALDLRTPDEIVGYDEWGVPRS